MKRNKAIILTIIFVCMTLLILIGMYELRLFLWKILAAALVLLGLTCATKLFYDWLMDDAPLDCEINYIPVDDEENDPNDIPLA